MKFPKRIAFFKGSLFFPRLFSFRIAKTASWKTGQGDAITVGIILFNRGYYIQIVFEETDETAS